MMEAMCWLAPGFVLAGVLATNRETDALLCNSRLRTRLMRRRRLLKGTITIAGLAALARLPAAAAAAGAGAFVCTGSDCDPYVYDPARGDAANVAQPGHPIPPGTAFEALPEHWRCPVCGAPKAAFARYDERVSNALRQDASPGRAQRHDGSRPRVGDASVTSRRATKQHRA